MIDIITLVFLVLLAIILAKENANISNIFLLVAGGLSAGGITTTQITSIASGTITYTTMDPIISYVIMITFIGIALMNWLDLIDRRKKEKDDDYEQ